MPYHIPKHPEHPGRRLVEEIGKRVTQDTRGVPTDYHNQMRGVRRATNVPTNQTCKFLDQVRFNVNVHYSNTTLVVADAEDAAWMAAFMGRQSTSD